jgi:hypothetical protein
MNPEGPLIPAWPDVRPVNAWCLPQTILVPHIDRVLATLGLPVESRTSMITAWLPGITRHKNIVRPFLLVPLTSLRSSWLRQLTSRHTGFLGLIN